MYRTDDGIPYFHNYVTNETIWEVPAVVRREQERLARVREEEEWRIAEEREKERQAQREAEARAKQGAEDAAESRQEDGGDKEEEQDPSAHHENIPANQDPLDPATFDPSKLDPATRRAAISATRKARAFLHMLKEAEVSAFSVWRRVLPRIAADPRFTDVPTMDQRRALFDHFIKQEQVNAAKTGRTGALAQARERWQAVLEEAARKGTLHPDTNLDAFLASAPKDTRESASLLSRVDLERDFDAVHRSVFARAATEAEESFVATLHGFEDLDRGTSWRTVQSWETDGPRDEEGKRPTVATDSRWYRVLPDRKLRELFRKSVEKQFEQSVEKELKQPVVTLSLKEFVAPPASETAFAVGLRVVVVVVAFAEPVAFAQSRPKKRKKASKPTTGALTEAIKTTRTQSLCARG